jgi:rRNA maturation endonuclease Nob1
LDTSAFLAGFDPFSIAEEQYTVPMVREEIKENSMAWVRFKTAVESGKLRVRTPAKAFIDRMEASATFVGDSFFLSKADQ